MILEDDQIQDILKENLKVKDHIKKGREIAKELFALIQGDDFKEELIHKIEHLESGNKAEARKKYSRAITDFFERLLQPIGNIYSSVGGSKNYNIDNENIKIDYLKNVSSVSGNMSLEKWLRQNWMPLYHTDPNGVIYWEHKETNAYPTYKSINKIRNYNISGQNIEWILFEPEKVKVENTTVMKWRIVDDAYDRIYIQTNSEFILQDEMPNEFRRVPGVVNSDISKLGEDWRVSPIDKIVQLCKEYARDQSIKTIYKFQSGFPIHWRYVSQCRDCTGTGVTGEGICKTCGGKGYIQKGDVTDQVTITVPEEGDPVLAPNIAGFITPDLETWTQYNTELDYLEEIAYRTHWSVAKTNNADGQAETATGRYIDLQPQINKLNEYADTAEWVEMEMSEMLLNFMNPTKNVDEREVYINYGRRYILESADTILEKYHTSKDNDDNSTIKDRLLSEYITAKYKNDPQMLRESLLKAKVEPYIHEKIEEVEQFFGSVEAARKIYFNKWWNLEADKEKTPEQLIEDYKNWFNQNYIENASIRKEDETSENGE
jgi:hypothetical protein